MQILSCPSGGRNRKTPFLAGNGGSRNFRIPCLWAGEDGALYAAADVRWDSEADGGGLAVAFARSRDGGENWEYSFPGFLGDSGGRHDRSASTLMDPMLTVSGNTVFLLCDLFPHGRAMLTGEAGAEKKLSPGNGFDGEGRLRLRARGEPEYRFRLENGAIRDETGKIRDDYEVGPWFSLRGRGEESNLFFRGAPFEVFPTSYLCLLISRDGGESWEAPVLLPGKREEEAFLGTAPGRGLVTRRGDLLFPVYNGEEASILFSKDGGGSFRRSPGVPGTESQLVEIPDGRIRAFLRNRSGYLHYVDFEAAEDGYRPGKLVEAGPALCSDCMASALSLPGKDFRIALSAPSGKGSRAGRFGGKLLVFGLDGGGGMTLLTERALGGEEDFFAYSCLAALPDGALGVLYEDSCLTYLGEPRGEGFSRVVFRKLSRPEDET